MANGLLELKSLVSKTASLLQLASSFSTVKLIIFNELVSHVESI